MHHSKNSHSGQLSTRHCSTTFQLKSKLKYILIIEILDQDPHSYWALNPEFESLLCLILNRFIPRCFIPSAWSSTYFVWAPQCFIKRAFNYIYDNLWINTYKYLLEDEK